MNRRSSTRNMYYNDNNEDIVSQSGAVFGNGGYLAQDFGHLPDCPFYATVNGPCLYCDAPSLPHPPRHAVSSAYGAHQANEPQRTFAQVVGSTPPAPYWTGGQGATVNGRQSSERTDTNYPEPGHDAGPPLYPGMQFQAQATNFPPVVQPQVPYLGTNPRSEISYASVTARSPTRSQPHNPDGRARLASHLAGQAPPLVPPQSRDIPAGNRRAGQHRHQLSGQSVGSSGPRIALPASSFQAETNPNPRDVFNFVESQQRGHHRQPRRTQDQPQEVYDTPPATGSHSVTSASTRRSQHEMKQRSDAFPFPCERCGKFFSSIGHVQKHFKRYCDRETPRPVSCNFPGCKMRFNFPRELHRHRKSGHNNPDNVNDYACAVAGCLKSFNRTDNRDRHERNVHGYDRHRLLPSPPSTADNAT